MIRRIKTSIIIVGMGMMLLIFDSKTAVEGAKIGVDLCIKTVVPSLFPFFVLSMIITASAGINDSMMVKRLARMMKIPESAISVLVPAFLGGYPVGAKCVADLYRNRMLKKQEAEYLLSFCSNAGPSFLFGMVASYFPNKAMAWKLWMIHIASAILTSLFFRSGIQETCTSGQTLKEREISDYMLSAVKAISVVCGWVILFRIMITFLNRWLFWRLPSWVQVLLTGLLELSNGCCELIQLRNELVRFVICGIMLSFGGLCVLFQTLSVTKGLSLRNYIMGKTIQALLSGVFCVVAVSEYGLIYIVCFLFLILFFMNLKINCRNSKRIPV